jgi:hypothetical protein
MDGGSAENTRSSYLPWKNGINPFKPQVTKTRFLKSVFFENAKKRICAGKARRYELILKFFRVLPWVPWPTIFRFWRS